MYANVRWDYKNVTATFKFYFIDMATKILFILCQCEVTLQCSFYYLNVLQINR